MTAPEHSASAAPIDRSSGQVNSRDCDAVGPRSAYIHVPFCRHRCGYCNFTLVAGRDELIDAYLSALELELSWLGAPREVDTLFIGGGTPTHLRGPQLKRLLSTVQKWHPPGGESLEFSVEANPNDISAETIRILTEYGVTRLSLGAQSFDVAKLSRLERDHNAEQIANAVSLARSAGLDTSIDLIFGAPGETLEAWQQDLQQALDLEPQHISTYGLTFERGAPFWSRLQRGEIAPVAEDVERSMYAAAIDRLGAAGFEHYEVSNFATRGKRCRHNEVYWTDGEYFAAGPGAARHLRGVRETNHRSLTTWLRRIQLGQSPVSERECLSELDRARELFVFGLRRMQGITRTWFAQRTGFVVDQIFAVALKKFVQNGFMIDDGETIRLSQNGLFVSDSLWPDFLAAD